MAGFNELLNQIRQKPGLYLGAPSVSGLYLFLCGYGFARQEQGLTLTAEEKAFEQFQPWIQERFGIQASVSWAKIIVLYSTDEQGGFELFYELWDEFLMHQQALDDQEKIVA
ncbi:MAG: hypothetical protein F6K11_03925 [Leptolyngbya sp. SIO3F4]|nr:hypothetical protein [Leptolyngbya sp. SIO3F4]